MTFTCTHTCTDMNINMYRISEYVHVHELLHLHPEYEHEPEHVQRTITGTFSYYLHVYK